MVGRGASAEDALVVARFTEVLAAAGPACVSGALRVLVDELGLASAVLHDPSRRSGSRGAVRAVAGDVVRAVPLMRLRPAGGDEPVPAVDLAVSAAGTVVGTLVVSGARPSQLPLLRACAGVLGLALSASVVGPDETALRLLDAAEDDRDALADRLHDGPVQDVVAARFALDLAARRLAGTSATTATAATGGTEPTGAAEVAAAHEAVSGALAALRRVMWDVRPRGGDDLGEALAALSARRSEGGGAPLLLRVDPTAALPAPVARLAFRLVQSLAAAGGPLEVTLVSEPGRTVLDVAGASLPEAPRWALASRAAGAELWHTRDQVRLQLAAAPVPFTAPPLAAGPALVAAAPVGLAVAQPGSPS